jgi:hypothetical protein
MDDKRLSAIARNPNHPMHTHAKAELVRRKVRKAEIDEQKVDEISLDDLKAKISSSGLKSTKKAMGADKIKKDIEAMKAKLATEADQFGRLGITSPTMKHIDKKLDKVTKRTQTVMNKRPRSTMEEKDPEEYDNEGSMMKSQLRQICSANEKLMSMVKDDDNLPEWVQAKVTKATDYIRSVRDYLESEKMDDEEEMDESVDWVCGKCNCDPCTCGEEIEEKTLTPAEKRKREKIAKAIERDNPDMPMDKKMAIATATAKRVAEVSSSKLSDYIRKSAADVSKSRGDARRQDKRIAGQSMADKKIRKKMGYSSTAKVPAGKNEQTDLSRIRTILDRNKK